MDSLELWKMTSGMLLSAAVASVGSLAAIVVGCGDNRQAQAKRNASHMKRSANSKSRSAKRVSSSKSRKATGSVSSKKSGGSVSSRSSSKKRPMASTKGKKKKNSMPSEKSSLSSKTARSSKTSKRSSRSQRSASDKLKKGARQVKRGVKKAGEALVEGLQQQEQPSSGSADRLKKPQQLEQIDVCVEPKELTFNSKGGQQQLILKNNEANKRFAVKIKCSDNILYRVNPVYLFLEPGRNTTVTVTRQNGIAKVDKLLLVVAPVSKDESSSRSVFNTDATYPMMVVPLMASMLSLPDSIQNAAAGAMNAVTYSEPARVLC